MKRNGKCVKCGSPELIRVPVIPGEGPHIAVGDRTMYSVPLRHIVCGTCGYIEVWIDGKENLSRLRKEYGKA